MAIINDENASELTAHPRDTRIFSVIQKSKTIEMKLSKKSDLNVEINIEEILSKIIATGDLPAAYVDFIKIIRPSDFEGKEDVFSSIMSIYIYSRTKKMENIRSWLSNGRVTVSGQTFLLSVLYNKILNFVKATETKERSILEFEKMKGPSTAKIIKKQKSVEAKIDSTEMKLLSLFDDIVNISKSIETHLGAGLV